MEAFIEALVWLAKAAGTGAVSFLAQRIIASAYQELSKLRSKSQISTADQDMKELLTHLEDEVGSLECPENFDPVDVIRLRAEISAAYWAMRVQQLSDLERNEADQAEGE